MALDPLVTPTLIGMGQSLSIVTSLLPKIDEVRKRDPATDPEFAGDVRMGELSALILATGIGAIVSALTNNSKPVLVSIIIALMVIALYELTLRAKRPMERVEKIVQ